MPQILVLFGFVFCLIIFLGLLLFLNFWQSGKSTQTGKSESHTDRSQSFEHETIKFIEPHVTRSVSIQGHVPIAWENKGYLYVAHISISDVDSDSSIRYFSKSIRLVRSQKRPGWTFFIDKVNIDIIDTCLMHIELQPADKLRKHTSAWPNLSTEVLVEYKNTFIDVGTLRLMYTTPKTARSIPITIHMDPLIQPTKKQADSLVTLNIFATHKSLFDTSDTSDVSDASNKDNPTTTKMSMHMFKSVKEVPCLFGDDVEHVFASIQGNDCYKKLDVGLQAPSEWISMGILTPKSLVTTGAISEQTLNLHCCKVNIRHTPTAKNNGFYNSHKNEEVEWSTIVSFMLNPTWSAFLSHKHLEYGFLHKNTYIRGGCPEDTITFDGVVDADALVIITKAHEMDTSMCILAMVDLTELKCLKTITEQTHSFVCSYFPFTLNVSETTYGSRDSLKYTEGSQSVVLCVGKRSTFTVEYSEPNVPLISHSNVVPLPKTFMLIDV